MSNEVYTFPAMAIVAVLLGFIVFLPLVPLIAMFFLWLWNDVMSYLHLPHIITYWQSVKLCFLLYVIQCLFNVKLSASVKG